MNRAKYAAPFRKRLDDVIGNPRSYDALIRRPGTSQIRTIRNALGVTAIELAKRMDISYVRISQLEKAERESKIKLEVLEQAAEVMNCHLVVAFIPKTDSFAALGDIEQAS